MFSEYGMTIWWSICASNRDPVIGIIIRSSKDPISSFTSGMVSLVLPSLHRSAFIYFKASKIYFASCATFVMIVWKLFSVHLYLETRATISSLPVLRVRNDYGILWCFQYRSGYRRRYPEKYHLSSLRSLYFQILRYVSLLLISVNSFFGLYLLPSTPLPWLGWLEFQGYFRGDVQCYHKS